MKWIKENKKNFIMCVLGIVIFLVCIIVLTIFTKNFKNNKQKLGLDLYNQVHELYYFGGKLSYDSNSFIEKEDKSKFIKIKNYDVISDLISSDFIEKTHKFLNIEKVNEDYFMKRVGKGLSGYHGTELKLKKFRNNSYSYDAVTTLCEKEHIVTYGTGCETGYTYTITKPFKIVKENGKWKIAEYTSVFEFTDKELK